MQRRRIQRCQLSTVGYCFGGVPKKRHGKDAFQPGLSLILPFLSCLFFFFTSPFCHIRHTACRVQSNCVQCLEISSIVFTHLPLRSHLRTAENKTEKQLLSESPSLIWAPRIQTTITGGKVARSSPGHGTRMKRFGMGCAPKEKGGNR